eukprot:364885-Chlamydomonas_euryale.AAC.7
MRHPPGPTCHAPPAMTRVPCATCHDPPAMRHPPCAGARALCGPGAAAACVPVPASVRQCGSQQPAGADRLQAGARLHRDAVVRLTPDCDVGTGSWPAGHGIGPVLAPPRHVQRHAVLSAWPAVHFDFLAQRAAGCASHWIGHRCGEPPVDLADCGDRKSPLHGHRVRAVPPWRGCAQEKEAGGGQGAPAAERQGGRGIDDQQLTWGAKAACRQQRGAAGL